MNRLASFLALLLVLFLGAYTFIPSVRWAVNEYVFMMERVDEETDYGNRKQVEDTARSMISNYEFAVGEYETYKVFCETAQYDKDRCQRALDSKTSANKTASTYNNYLLKNKFLFKGNMPADIYYALETIK